MLGPFLGLTWPLGLGGKGAMVRDRWEVCLGQGRERLVYLAVWFVRL